VGGISTKETGGAGCLIIQKFIIKAMKKSLEEIEALKRSWRRDPNWDIEETEGFEDHKEELRAYRKQQGEEWGQKERVRLIEKSAMLCGTTAALELIKYLETLEAKIEALQLDKDRRDGYAQIGL